MEKEMIVCPKCTQIIRSNDKNNKGTLFKCKNCKTEVFIPRK